MMRLLLIALLMPAAPAFSAPLQPTAKWVVNFDEQQCLAQRDYGTASDPIQLVFKQPARGEVMQVAVLAGGRFGKLADQVEGFIGFDQQPVNKLSALRWRPEGSKQTIRLLNVPLNAFAPIQSAQTMRVDVGAFRQEFALSDVPELMRVMNVCLEDLRKAWHVRGDDEDRATAPDGGRDVQGNLSGLITASDYPGISIQRMEKGSVVMVLLVNEKGRVADCSLIETSGVAALDAQSCRIVTERARFTPAVGADGKPRKSSFVQRITWKLR